MSGQSSMIVSAVSLESSSSHGLSSSPSSSSEKPINSSAHVSKKPSIIYNSGPCKRCNLQLQTATEIISYVGMAFGAMLVIIGSCLLASEPKLEKEHQEDIDKYANSIEYSSVISLVRGFYDIFFYAMLWFGAIWRSRKMCLGWFILKLILTSFLIIGSLIVVSLYGYVYFLLAPVILFLPEIYFLYVVLCFTEELKVVGGMGGQPSVQIEPGNVEATEMGSTGIYGTGEKIQEVYPDYTKRAREIQARQAMQIQSMAF